MARKNILTGLLATPAPVLDSDVTPARPALPATRPRQTRGAVGAISQSIADLRARAVVEIDPFLIEAGGLQDRISSDDAEDQLLARSIAEHGQQVPILVRPHPTKDGHYQIVYGRRRVLALRDIGQPAKALIRDLDDRELILAQGQENNARRDLSFIEKASFALRMEAAGYDRKTICDALSLDKTLISRMISVVDQIPEAVILVIGSAPSVGRDRWIELSDLLTARAERADTLPAMLAVSIISPTSDDRFREAINYLKRPVEDASARPVGRPRGPKSILRGAEGRRLGETVRNKEVMVIRLALNRTQGFEDWLVEMIPELHRQWDEGDLPHGDPKNPPTGD